MHRAVHRTAVRYLHHALTLLLAQGTCEFQRPPELVDLAAALRVSDRLIFFETSRASTYMRAADLLVMPSRLEGFAYTMIEALAAGLPIVTYNVGGADDLVIQAHTGYVVPQGDEGVLAQHAGEIIGNPSLQLNMAIAAQDHYQRFKLDAMLDHIAGVYSTLQAPLAQDRPDIAVASHPTS